MERTFADERIDEIEKWSHEMRTKQRFSQRFICVLVVSAWEIFHIAIFVFCWFLVKEEARRLIEKETIILKE